MTIGQTYCVYRISSVQYFLRRIVNTNVYASFMSLTIYTLLFLDIMTLVDVACSHFSLFAETWLAMPGLRNLLLSSKTN